MVSITVISVGNGVVTRVQILDMNPSLLRLKIDFASYPDGSDGIG